MEAAATGLLVNQQTIKSLLCASVGMDCGFCCPFLLSKISHPVELHWLGTGLHIWPFILGVKTSHRVDTLPRKLSWISTKLPLLPTYIFAWPLHLLSCVNQV